MVNTMLKGNSDAGNPCVRLGEKKPYRRSHCGARWYLGALFALAACCAGAAITTPTLYKQCGYINGYLNICFQKSTLDTTATLQVQVKPHEADDSAYALAFSIAASSGGAYTANKYDGWYFRFATNLVGQIDVRVRLWKADDDYTEWLALDNNPICGYTRLTGTVIGTNSDKKNGFDGNMFSVADGSGSVGYDFGEAKRIRGIRWFARPDNCSAGGGYGDSCFGRILGSTFDYANDASFSDGVTILTCTRYDQGGNTSPFMINEYWFEEPVTARYIRYIKPGTAYGGLNEFEVIPWDCPYKPVASVTRSDVTNFWPVVTWTYQAGLDPTEVRVERSTSASGPFTAVTDWQTAGTGGTFTNDTAYGEEPVPFVGLAYYYRVVAKTGNAEFIEAGVPQEVASTVLSYRRYRRLDRAWGAESTFLSGVSMIAYNTNGVAIKTGEKAWDGDVSTKPDSSDTLRYGPVGLTFANKTSVRLFGYVCRNDNWCYVRIKNTAVYSSAADDDDYSEMVKRSEYVSTATQDATLYLQDITVPSEDGEDRWFLYATRSFVDGGFFGGNVAELMFFGYDAQDIINAGVVIAPTELSFATTDDHLGIVVSWNAGANADDGYDVERRVRGSEDAWSTLGSVAAGVTTFTDTTVTQGYWEYRVTAKKGSDTASSDAFSRAYYAPAGGTGLKRIVYWPFTSTNTAFTITDKCELPDGPVDFDFADGTPVWTDGPTSRMFIACEGKLVVPFAGSYTFTHVTSDGGSLWIDGITENAYWTGAGKTVSSTFELTAGEHAIRVYVRLGDSTVNGRRLNVLKWSGPVAEETIPSCQFKPAADFYRFDADSYLLYRQYHGTDWGYATSSSATRFTVRGTRAALGSNRTHLNVACGMLKGRSARCEMEFEIARNESAYMPNGVGGLIVHGENGNALLFCFDTNNGAGNCVARCRAVTNGVDAVVSVGTSAQDSITSRWYRYMRFVYDSASDSYVGYHKYALADEWTQLFSLPNNGNFSSHAQIGFFAAGGGKDQTGCFDFTVTRFREFKGFTIIVR